MGSQGLHRAAARARRGVSGAGRRHERGDWGQSWSVGAVALVVGIGVVLGGCSTAAPEVEKTPSVVSEAPSPTSTPTPTPTGPVKPERPADMDRTDEVGAAAAATYFLELYPYVMATGDLEEWERISLVDLCEFCVKVSADVASQQAARTTYSGGDVEVDVTKTYPLDTLLGAFPVDVVLSQDASVIADEGGNVVDSSESASGPLRVEVMNDGVAWLLLEVSTNMPTS